MLFFGWGSKTKDFVVDERQRVVVAYTYVHIFFVLTVAWGRRFHHAQWTEAGWTVAEVSEPEARAINGGITADIHPWWKWSLLGFIALGIGWGAIAAVFAL